MKKKYMPVSSQAIKLQNKEDLLSVSIPKESNLIDNETKYNGLDFASKKEEYWSPSKWNEEEE